VSETLNTQPVTNCLLDGIPEHNTDIFDSMMAVDTEIAFGGAGKIETPVLCHRGKHMVKKWHTAVN
jgi:hypothetical protein